MRPVIVPNADVNSESCLITQWLVDEGTTVHAGDVVAEVETSKAVIEVVAPVGGIVGRAAEVGSVVPMGATIAHVFVDEQALADHAERQREMSLPSRVEDTHEVHASSKAKALADAHGLDLRTLHKSGLITLADVETALRRPLPSLPTPVTGEPGVQRIVVIGAGLGATQVLDILSHDAGRAVVALVDDDESRWGDVVNGIPIVGGSARLGELLESNLIDAAVISISTSVAARRSLREQCQRARVPLVNVIDPTAKLAVGVRMGTGNVICAFVHIGAEAEIGDNNFLSAYNSFDHHCVLRSDISTGPGCMASGVVTVGDGARLGTGIFIEPHVTIGDNVRIASGVVLRQSVPNDHTVKVKDVSTVIAPTVRT